MSLENPTSELPSTTTLPRGFQPVSQTYPYIKQLLFGPAGAGKTTWAAQAPNPVWLDSENSTETLRAMGPPYSEIPVKKMRNYENPQLIIDDVERLIKSDICETIVLDSLTSQLYSFVRAYVRSQAAKPKSRRTDNYTTYEADWGYATSVFIDLFTLLSDAPINVIQIGHEKSLKLDDENPNRITSIVPDVTPRLQASVTRLVNVVSYLQRVPNPTGPDKRRLYLNPTSVIESKNRLNIQETYLENPTWDDLYGKVLSNHG